MSKSKSKGHNFFLKNVALNVELHYEQRECSRTFRAEGTHSIETIRTGVGAQIRKTN